MRGGKREGSGRPKGATQKPRFSDFITIEEVKELVQTCKEQAKSGKPELLKFMLEQIFGKAPQSITGPDGGALQIIFDQVFNVASRETKGDSIE